MNEYMVDKGMNKGLKKMKKNHRWVQNSAILYKRLLEWPVLKVLAKTKSLKYFIEVDNFVSNLAVMLCCKI